MSDATNRIAKLISEPDADAAGIRETTGQISLNGHTAEEVHTITLATVEEFGWVAQNDQPYETDHPKCETKSLILAVFHITHYEGLYRVVVSFQGDGEKRRCILTLRGYDTLDPPHLPDEFLADHFDDLFYKLAAALY